MCAFIELHLEGIFKWTRQDGWYAISGARALMQHCHFSCWVFFSNDHQGIYAAYTVSYHKQDCF